MANFLFYKYRFEQCSDSHLFSSDGEKISAELHNNRLAKTFVWRFRSKGPQKTDDYFGVKPPKKDFIINKKGRELGSRASIFRSIATQLS